MDLWVRFCCWRVCLLSCELLLAGLCPSLHKFLNTALGACFSMLKVAEFAGKAGDVSSALRSHLSSQLDCDIANFLGLLFR